MSVRKFFLVCLVFGLAVIGSILAQSTRPATAARGAACAWPNNISGAWTDAETWSCGAVPGSDDAVTVGFGAAIMLDSAEAVASLSMTGGSISGSGSLNVTGAMHIYDTVADVTISTVGSYFPTLLSSPYGGIVRITDPALLPGSLANVTISSPVGSNAASVLDTGAQEIGALTMENGNFSWNGPLVIANSLQWINGNLGSGNSLTMTIAAAAILTINEGSHSIYTSLVNEGTATWTGSLGIFGSYPAEFINNGTLNADVTGTPNVNIDGFAAFINNGVFRRNAGSETLYFDVPVINNGTFEVSAGNVRFYSDFTQNGGLFQLNGATIEGNNQYAYLTFTGGQIRGSGVITDHIRNEGGTLTPTGALHIVGSYTQGPSAALQITITGFTPATDFGALTVTPNQGIGGRVSLDGRLIVDKAGGFAPAAGDRFVMATCAANCNGSFSSVEGSMSPAFGGFAAGGEVVVAEPTNPAILQSKPDFRLGPQGGTNGFTLRVHNPSDQTLTISGLSATLPLSFTYQANSTSGALSANPFDQPDGSGSRLLYWPGSFQVAAGGEAALHFNIGITSDMPGGAHGIDWSATASNGGAANIITLKNVALIEVPLGASQGVTLGGSGALVANGQLPNLLLRSAGLGQAVIEIGVHVTCPFPAPCGNLSNVYVGQEVNGRGVSIFHLQPVPTAAGEQPSAEDYGFWKGTMPGEGVIPGVPIKIYPDWDAHRPCIAFDFSGTGIRPIFCVGGGDPIAVPHILYDPSGVIRDAATSAPIVGATVTLYRIWGTLPDTRDLTRDCRTVDTRPGGIWSGQAPEFGLIEDANLTPRQIDPQVNPQLTGADGRYGWNVVTGCWYVKVSAPGYAPKTSALVGVPPEVTDLDLTLDALNQPYQINLPQVRK
ncbi:MAG: hypothetical protein DWI57_04265 [Chloroflexi bacterium]|nr:MAG: hypothetical protein DWI57_04265 [Chloroflexota bacterium]